MLPRVLGTAAVGMTMLGVVSTPLLTARAVAASPSPSPKPSASVSASTPVKQHPATIAMTCAQGSPSFHARAGDTLQVVAARERVPYAVLKTYDRELVGKVFAKNQVVCMPPPVNHPASPSPTATPAQTPTATPGEATSPALAGHVTSPSHPAMTRSGSGAVLWIGLFILVCIVIVVITLYRQSRRAKSPSTDPAGPPAGAGAPATEATQAFSAPTVHVPVVPGPTVRPPVVPVPSTLPETGPPVVPVPSTPAETGAQDDLVGETPRRVQVHGALPAGVTAVRSSVAHSGLNPSGLILIDGFLIVRATAMPGQAPIAAGTSIDLFQSDGTRIPRRA